MSGAFVTEKELKVYNNSVNFFFIIGKVLAVLARRHRRIWSVSCDHSKKRSVRQVYNSKVYCKKGIRKLAQHQF